jgi:hypothetical protein
MAISAVGGFSPLLPVVPSGPRPGSGNFTASAPSSPNGVTPAATAPAQSAAALAIQQAEQPAHGGGSGGGHGHKAALKAIEDVATRTGLKIEVRDKSPADRHAEIERLKLLANIRAGQVNAKGDGEGREQGRRQQGGREQPRGHQEQPAAG